MRLFPAEEALLVIQGKGEESWFEYTIEEAWELLDEIVALGDAPSDLGRDISKWVAWVDYNYERRRRVSYGTAYFRLNGPATVKGRHRDSKPSFAQVVITVTPLENSSQIVIDHSTCSIPFAYQPDAVERASFLMAVAEGIQEYATRHRLVGIHVSVLEIHVHEFDSRPVCFKIAAGNAMHAAITEVGVDAI